MLPSFGTFAITLLELQLETGRTHHLCGTWFISVILSLAMRFMVLVNLKGHGQFLHAKTLIYPSKNWWNHGIYPIFQLSLKRLWKTSKSSKQRTSWVLLFAFFLAFFILLAMFHGLLHGKFTDFLPLRPPMSIWLISGNPSSLREQTYQHATCHIPFKGGHIHASRHIFEG